MLIQGKILSYGDDLSEVYEIRKKVFIEEQGMPEHMEYDDIDNEAMHVIVYEEGMQKKAVATGRIYFDGDSCQIGKVSVLQEFRNKKYGDFTVRMLLNKAFTAGINEVSVNAQINSIGFYETIGFHTTGSLFVENGKEYISMVIHIRDVITSCNKVK